MPSPLSPKSKVSKQFERTKKESFTYHSTDGKTLTFDQFVAAIRSLGVVISEAELRKVESLKFDWTRFSAMMDSYKEKHMIVVTQAGAQKEWVEELRKAFSAIDKIGKISANELKKCLISIGEVVTSTQFKTVFGHMEDGEMIDVEKFLEKYVNFF